jgi:hypothetical protein
MKKIALAAALAAGCVASSANAVVIFLDSVVQEGSNFRYTYGANFSDGEGIQAGSTLAIYDFAGYVPGSIVSSSPLLTTATPNSSAMMSLIYNDDPNVSNLEFTYTGPTQDLGNGRYTFGSALSRFGQTALDGFSAVTVKTDGAVGTLIGSQGATGVPLAAVGVPEPASWALLIGGFGMVGFAARRRQQTVRVAYA